MAGNDFDFISPVAFRKNIIESVEFTSWLWVTAQSIESKYVDDINRTIILYNISIIEALLLFRAKKRKIKFLVQEYKNPYKLPAEFSKANKIVVLAFRESTPKSDSQIWLSDLLKEKRNFLGKKLYEQIKNFKMLEIPYISQRDVPDGLPLKSRRNLLIHY